jgi:hypothetical protein
MSNGIDATHSIKIKISLDLDRINGDLRMSDVRVKKLLGMNLVHLLVVVPDFRLCERIEGELHEIVDV